MYGLHNLPHLRAGKGEEVHPGIRVEPFNGIAKGGKAGNDKGLHADSMLTP